MVDFTACEEESRKACDKYRIAKPDAAVVKRRWRIFLAIEAVLLTCFIGLFLLAKKAEFTPIAAAVLGPLVVFSLPVAVLYLLGKDPVMTLDPLWLSAGSRAMTRDVRSRAPLSDDEFYSRFYKRTAIQKETIARIRRYLQKWIDDVSDRLIPADYLPLMWEDLDFADVFYALGREFSVELSTCEGAFNGTLDGLIRLVHFQLESGPAVGRDA